MIARVWLKIWKVSRFMVGNDPSWTPILTFLPSGFGTYFLSRGNEIQLLFCRMAYIERVTINHSICVVCSIVWL